MNSFQEAEVYFANSDYIPIRPDGIPLAENQLVDVLDSHDPEQYLVRTRPRKDERPKIGWVDACFLEKKSTNIGQVSNSFVYFIYLFITHSYHCCYGCGCCCCGCCCCCYIHNMSIHNDRTISVESAKERCMDTERILYPTIFSTRYIYIHIMQDVRVRK